MQDFSHYCIEINGNGVDELLWEHLAAHPHSGHRLVRSSKDGRAPVEDAERGVHLIANALCHLSELLPSLQSVMKFCLK